MRTSRALRANISSTATETMRPVSEPRSSAWDNDLATFRSTRTAAASGSSASSRRAGSSVTWPSLHSSCSSSAATADGSGGAGAGAGTRARPGGCITRRLQQWRWAMVGGAERRRVGDPDQSRKKVEEGALAAVGGHALLSGSVASETGGGCRGPHGSGRDGCVWEWDEGKRAPPPGAQQRGGVGLPCSLVRPSRRVLSTSSPTWALFRYTQNSNFLHSLHHINFWTHAWRIKCR